MRSLPYCAALLLGACSSQNPLFGLGTDSSDTGAASSSSASTATPTSQGPTSNDTPATATGDSATGDGPGTGNPSEPLTTSTGHPETTAVDPNTTTGLDTGNTSSSETNDSDVANSSTGEPACLLTKDPDFDDRLFIEDSPKELCAANPTYFHGKLMANNGELRFNTSNTGCNGEENIGVLKLGLNYKLPVLNDSTCAKLYLFRDGPGPGCNIAQFFIVTQNPVETIVTGSFSPMMDAMNTPPALAAPDPYQVPCCPAEAQECCQDSFGDYALELDGTKVFPGTIEPAMYNGEVGRLYNIQYYDTADCVNDMPTPRHDWIAIRP